MTTKVKTESQRELDKAQAQFDAYDAQIKSLTLDKTNEAPKEEVEPQTKISQKDLAKKNEVQLKPFREIASREKFNEDFRTHYNFSSEQVSFIAENREIIGETIELWTKPFVGMPAQFWRVPTNIPVRGPRFLAEQIKNCKYHVFVMEQTQSTGSDHMGQYYGGMVAKKEVGRLDAIPVSTKTNIFMGDSGFR